MSGALAPVVEPRKGRLGTISPRTAEAPFTTGDLPDEVVNQRVYAVVAVSRDAEISRLGVYGLFVWMDHGSDKAGDPLWQPDPTDYRGQDGAGLSPDERRYIAASLHACAVRMIEKADEA